jgi:hypothetical protein
MMMQIKIQCGCGQHYAFDVEAAGDLQPDTVICPVCGADGTAAANAAIAQSLSAQPTVAAAAPAGGPRIRIATPPSAIHLATPAATPAPAARPRGTTAQPDRTQAEFEARAKILWGDPPEAVITYLMIQGIDRAEASDMVNEMFRERTATIRATGIRNIVVGTGLVAIPIVTLIIFLSIGMINLWIMAVTSITGLSGLWMVVTGIFKVLAPKSEAGDACDND